MPQMRMLKLQNNIAKQVISFEVLLPSLSIPIDQRSLSFREIMMSIGLDL